MERLFDPEEKVTCPYNPAHHIMRKRMNTHLVACKKNYPDIKLVVCDFNVNHLVPEPQLQYHHETCEDRRKIEHHVYHDEGTDIDKYPVHNVEVETDDSWDDSNVPTYDPKKYCEENLVICHMDVASAGARKDFRMGQRRKFNDLKANMPVQAPARVEPRVNSPPAQRRNLPERPRRTVEESVPELVSKLSERIQLGKNQSFIPKSK